MTYKQLMKEDYPFILYNQFLYTTVLYKRVPFKIIQYPASNLCKFIIFSETRTGSTTTRHITLSKEDAVFFRSWLANDFPNLIIETIGDNDNESI